MTPPARTSTLPVSVSDRPIRIFIAPTTTLSTRNDTIASTTGRQVRCRRAKTPATMSRIGTSTERWPILS